MRPGFACARRQQQAVNLLACTCAGAQPDEATLRQILSNSTVMEGFDDPSVMAVVAEVAQNPAAFSRHVGDAKVSSICSSLSRQPMRTSRLANARMIGTQASHISLDTHEPRP